MRPPQNKRMRGRNNNNNNHRRNTNSLTRSYESNGPDIKVRGTAAHIAEKYVQLARDAHVAGDPVAAESYLQHAEHYFRLIASIHAAQNPQPRQADGSPVDQVMGEEGEDDDFDGGINDRFTYRSPQAYQQASQQPGNGQIAGQPFANGEQPAGLEGAEQPVGEAPYGDNGRPDHQNRQNRFENRNNRNNRFDNRNRDFQRQDGGRDGNRQDFGPRQDNRPDNNRFENGRPENGRQDGSRFDRRDRNQPRGDRPDYRGDQQRYDNGRGDYARGEQARGEPPRGDQPRGEQPWQQDQPRFEPPRPARAPEIASVQPILPSFITAPVRNVPIVDADAGERASPPGPAAEMDAAPAPRKRGRRKIVPVGEDGEAAIEPAAE